MNQDEIGRGNFITGYATRKARMLQHPEALTRNTTINADMGAFAGLGALPQSYNLTQIRIPGEKGKGEITTFIEWVVVHKNEEREGFAVELPPQVCDAILRGRGALNNRRRRQAGKQNAVSGEEFKRRLGGAK